MYRKLRNLLLTVLTFTILGSGLYIMYNSQKNTAETIETQKENTEVAVDIEKQKLEEKIAKSKLFVDEIETLDSVIFGKTDGMYTLNHDRTPDGSVWTEWLVNADISVDFEYYALYSIDNEHIKLYVDDEGRVNATFDEKFFEVNAIDFKDVTFSENVSMLGRPYSKEDLLALHEIAKEDINNVLLEEENLEKATLSLEEHLYNEAKMFGLDTLVINNVIYDI